MTQSGIGFGRPYIEGHDGDTWEHEFDFVYARIISSPLHEPVQSVQNLLTAETLTS